MLPSRQPQRSTSTTTQPRTLQALQGRPKGSMVQRSAAGFFGFPELSKLHQAGIEAKLNASARLVLFNLAVYVNPDVGWKAWPQLKTLAEGTSLSERTVRRALRSLEKAQICRRIPHKKGRNANGLCEQLLPLLPLAQLNPNGGQPDPPRRTTGADDGGQPGPTTADNPTPHGGQPGLTTADNPAPCPPRKTRPTADRGCPPDLLTADTGAPVTDGQSACKTLTESLFLPAKYLGTQARPTADTMAAPQQTREQKDTRTRAHATADSRRPDAAHVLGAIADLRQKFGWVSPQQAQQSPKQTPLTLTPQPTDKGAHTGSKEPQNE